MNDNNARANNGKGNTKRPNLVIPASMLPLRAVLAKVSTESAARKMSQSNNPKEKKKVKERKINKGVKSRNKEDRKQHKKEHRKKSWKAIKSSLEKKSAKYDELALQSKLRNPKAMKESEKFLVNFTGSSGIEGHIDESEIGKSKLVQIQDEFGRTISVPERSSRYRSYLAEEARKVRVDEINRTSYLQDLEPKKSNFPLIKDDNFHATNSNQKPNIAYASESSNHIQHNLNDDTQQNFFTAKTVDSKKSPQLFEPYRTFLDAPQNKNRIQKKKERIELLREKRIKRDSMFK